VATQRKRPAHKLAHRGDIQIKRIYDDPDAADGFRALVDRLWPRGISKQRAAIPAGRRLRTNTVRRRHRLRTDRW
jgi:uncharacterized protein YeaO (DUF488 family)